jgi:CPA2 family monovalent cation:H+ antiporter-2
MPLSVIFITDVSYADEEEGDAMHSASLLIDIAVVLVAAVGGGVLARRLGLPTIVGYLIAGMVVGPFTLKFVGDATTIQQFAELGVVFLLFGVGLHFSLGDLWAVRAIALPGALAQIVLVTALGFALTRLWGWSVPAGIVFGIAISVSSTVVLMRALMDRGLLNTIHGRVAVGWLVVEDIVSVLVLALLPALVPANGNGTPRLTTQSLAMTLLKAAVFAILMLVAGTRFVPWLLLHIAHLRSRELFIVTVAALVFGTAVVAADLFGVSPALGAFLAGVVVSESSTRYQVSAEVLPFRETFTVLFFISVGMLVDPRHALANAGLVVALTALIVVGKSVFTVLSGFVLPAAARTMLVVGAGRSQIGEFSFILGQMGVVLGVLTLDQYSVLLAGAVLSILVNPFMFRAMPLVESLLRRVPGLWRVLDRHGPAPRSKAADLRGHVVVVGYGRVGEHLVNVLGRLNVPRLVVEIDIGRTAELERQAVPTLYGDAADSEVLDYAGLDRARALVVTLPDEIAAGVVVAAAHDQAPHLPIIARAATQAGIEQLLRLGAQEVIQPELEGGLEILRYTLVRLGFPASEVEGYANAVRHDRYDTSLALADEREALDNLLQAPPLIDVSWFRVEAESPLVGQPLSAVRFATGKPATVIAILREGQLVPHLDSTVRLRANDMVSIIGESGASERDMAGSRSESEHGADGAGGEFPQYIPPLQTEADETAEPNRF